MLPHAVPMGAPPEEPPAGGAAGELDLRLAHERGHDSRRNLAGGGLQGYIAAYTAAEGMEHRADTGRAHHRRQLLPGIIALQPEGRDASRGDGTKTQDTAIARQQHASGALGM